MSVPARQHHQHVVQRWFEPYQGGGQITKVALPQSAQSGLTPQYSTLTNTPVLAGSDAYSSSLTAYGPGTGSARIYFMTNQGKLYCFQ